MKTIILISVLLSGCAMTPTQKRVVIFSAGVVATGLILSQEDGQPDPGRVRTPQVNCGKDRSTCF